MIINLSELSDIKRKVVEIREKWEKYDVLKDFFD